MLLPRLRFTLILVFLLTAAASIAQTTLNVGPGQPYTTIQSGIDAAKDGDTVLVAPGTYTENINFNGKAITVTSSDGAAAIIIDGGNKGGAATVVFATGEKSTSTIANFTIRGGGSDTYGGNSNGGVYVSNTSPVIRNNIITANYCHNIDIEFGIATILNNEVSGVLQDTQGTQGKGLCTFPSAIHLGGTPDAPPFVDFVPGTTVVGNTIENNLTGSGLNLWAAQNVVVRNNVIRDNLSSDPGSAFLSVNDSGTVVFQNLIYGNTSACGGALAFMEAGLGSTQTILIANNTIVDNTWLDQFNGSECTAIAQIYPAPYAYGSSGPSALVINNIISGSTPYPAVNCSQIQSPSESIQPTFQNNILYNAGGPFFGPDCIDVSGKYNNIVAQPQFVSPSTGDYHLQSTSPAIDVGQNSVIHTLLSLTGQNFTTDFDGAPRIQDATGHGCTIDIGAYEYPGTKSICGANLTLASSLNPSSFGQTVTFTAQLTSNSGTPTGSIQFSDGATVLGTATISTAGTATFSTGQLTVGSHTITAAFQPTGNFPAVNATLTQVVNGYPSSTQLTSSLNPATVGQSITFTAAVASPTGTPAGTVTFADGSTTLAVVPVTSGSATYTTSALAVGSHAITATLTPSGAYASSTATLTETIIGQPTSTTLAVTPNPATAFSTLTLTSTVTASSGTPSGTVTFTANGAKLGSTTLNAGGAASLSVTAPAPGTYSITAVYSGDTAHNASTSAAVTETITAAPSATALTASPNPAYQAQPVTLTASVTGVPGQTPAGTVTFFDGSTSLGTGALSASGTASLTVSMLTPGTHTLTASYAATGGYAASISPPVQEVILPGTFAITLSPSSVTVGPARNGTVQIALNSIGGFSGPLQLSFGTVPTYATATINPSTITLAAGGAGSADLLLNAATARLEPSPFSGPGRPAAVFAAIAVLLLPLRRKHRKLLCHVLGTLLLAALFTGATGCGTVGFPFHTAAPGTYKVPVTATDTRGNSQSAMLTLTLTP